MNEREKSVIHALFYCQRYVGERNSMIKEKELDTDFRIPSGNDYEKDIAKASAEDRPIS